MVIQLVEAAAILALVAATVVAVIAAGAALSPPRPDAPPPPDRPADPPCSPLPPNAVLAAGRLYLRVLVPTAPAALHLAARARDRRGPAGRPAVDDAPGQAPAYNPDLVRMPIWAARTLCNARWTAMADHAAETEALIAHAKPAHPDAYVCPTCAARVIPGHPVPR
jgi:hypothetical protein